MQDVEKKEDRRSGGIYTIIKGKNTRVSAQKARARSLCRETAGELFRYYNIFKNVPRVPVRPNPRKMGEEGA